MALHRRLLVNPALRISLIYIGIASGWILFSDKLLNWFLPAPADLTLLQSIKGVGFVLVTASILYWLIRFNPAGRHQHFAGMNDRRGRRHLPLVLFVALTIGIGATGWLTYSSLKSAMLKEAINSLSGIGRLKADQLDLWVRNTIRDSELITRNSAFAVDAGKWLEQGAGEDKRKALVSLHLQRLIENSHYSGAILFDREGNAILATKVAEIEIIQHRHDALKAMATASTVLVDFHFLDSTQRGTELGLASPLTVQDKVVGAIYFSIDPTQFLYPLIQRWPVPTETAETALIRQDGNRAVFLTALKHGNHPPLAFSLPPTDSTLPAVRALRGERGGMQGIDYRGVEVLAYADAIPNTPWKILAKQDSSEALSTIHRMAVITTVVTFFLLTIAGTLLWLWWRRELIQFAVRIEMDKRLLARHYDYLSKYANDMILLTDESGKVIEANDRALQCYGYSRDELLGKRMCDLRTETVADYTHDQSDDYGVIFESEHHRKDGSTFPAEVSARLIEEGGRTIVHMVVRDITERKTALEKLRFAQLVVESSPVILWRWRATDGWPTEYVSENVIQFGYAAEEFLSGRLAYADIIHPDDIGRVEEEVARNSAAGISHYTQQYRITCKNGDIRWLDDRTTVIRDEQGNITHYQGTTTDITVQKAAEISLQVSEERFRNIFDAVSDAVILYDANTDRMMDANPRASEMSGYSHEELLMLHAGELSSGEPHYTKEDARLQIQRSLSEDVASFEWHAKDKTGRLFWVEISTRRTLIAGQDMLLITLRDIDDRKQAEERAKKAADILQLALEGAAEAVWEVDVETGEAYVSEEYYHLLDQPPDPPPTSMQKWVARLHPDDREQVPATFRRMVEADVERYQIEFRLCHRDGHYLWMLGRAKTVERNALGKPKRLVGTFIDITERKTTELRLRLDAEVFRHSGEGIIITDANTNILTVNPAFVAISGYSEAEVLGKTPRLLKSDRHDAGFYQALWESLVEDGIWQGEIWNRRKNGEVYPEWLHITSVRNTDGQATNYIGVFSDLSQSKHMQERITQLSRYDPVTGLPNLFFFDDLLSLAISEAEQQRHGIAIMRLDIENFHDIDDTYGFEAGDQALKIVAERLVKIVDNEGFVTRLAKDNFSIAFPYIKDVMQATLLADSLQKAVSEPILVDRHEIHPGVKLGISFYPSDGRTSKDLVQRAGIALNHAKADKRSNLRFFEQRMNDLLLSKIVLTNDIRHAIEHEEFELYYQPQLDLATGQVTGLEALVRWNHPVHGFLPPSEFVLLAEESGLIVPLGDWILKRAMLQMKEWRNAGMTDLSIAVAVNASAIQMESGDLVDLLQNLLSEIGLPASSIELELTESLLMNNVGETQKLLQRLKAMGIRLSIDDFGTGYSSLSYLKQFSVDKLKIDKSFIDNVTTDPNDAVIVQATIAMARSMGLKVIAEGVETEAQAGYLRTLHCDQIQGYYFSRPLPANEIMPLLLKNAGKSLKPIAQHQRNLLLVDDEPNVLSSLKRILRREGYQITIAGSGEEALQSLAEHPVGVIVSDQRMPEMSGIEFMSRVKVMYPGTVRIILSGYTDVGTITEAVNKGEVYKFLTKPWDDDELRDTIKEAFQRYEENHKPITDIAE